MPFLTTEFAEITQNNNHYAVQGHSRSPIFVPSETSYATSYKWLILTYHLSCTVSEIQPSIGPKSLYLATPLAFNPPPRREGSPHHIIIVVSDISLKLEGVGYISVAESLRISSSVFTQCASKATEFAEITQNNGHYAVQGHSRSPILIPIESSYTTSY